MDIKEIGEDLKQLVVENLSLEDAQALLDIASERRRQVQDLGHKPEHDDLCVADELALAAAVYAVPPTSRDNDLMGLWPWDLRAFKPGEWNEDLKRAGALLVAEYGRQVRLRTRVR